METRSYLRALGWRRWILVAVPVVAGAVALPLLLGQSQRYRAGATVAMPRASDETLTPSIVAQFAASFGEALTSERVASSVAAATGVAAEVVRDGLSSAQLGTSEVVRVSYVGTDPRAASDVVTAATERTIDALFGPLVAFAERDVARATARYESTWAAMQRFVDEHGLADPELEYRVRAGEVAQLRVAAERARAAGDAAAVAQLEASIVAGREALAAIAASLLEFERIDTDRAIARAAMVAAEGELERAEGRLASADRMTASTADARAISRTAHLAQGVGAVVALGLALALGALWVLEALRPRARGVRPDQPELRPATVWYG